tara:strand:+ start:1759 stop:2244 length:486 start_codon:yes stop_codon:yes gene_type:complete
MVQIKIADKKYQIENNKINNTSIDWDLLDNSDGTFHIIKNHKTYKAVLLEKDEAAKKMTISLNGNEYTVDLKDKFDLLLDKLGMSNLTVLKLKDVKAPMPGLVFKMHAKMGDTIAKGDALLILEAMKMENVLKATGEGRIKAIKVSEGEAVEKGQVLIELE